MAKIPAIRDLADLRSVASYRTFTITHDFED